MSASSSIPYARQWITEEDIQAVEEVLRSPYLTQGPKVEAFENDLAEVTGAPHAVAVSNGTTALHLASALVGLKPGSLGVTSPITFAATANCLLYCGARVRFADVDPFTGLMQIDSLQEILEEETKRGLEESSVIMPVSLAGRAGDLPEIREIAEKFHCMVVEDAAHSLGATYADSKKLLSGSGSCRHTDAATLSFHPVKHICCGEGGAFLTANSDLAEKARHLRSHGICKPFENEQDTDLKTPRWFQEQTDLGWNYRMTELQAALGISQLKRLPEFIDRRRQLAKRYRQEFSTSPYRDLIQMPPEDNGHAYHLFVLHFPDSRIRNSAYEFLRERNIGSQVHYIPVYRHPYYEELYGRQRLPGAEAYFGGCLSIPLYPKLSDEEQEIVIDTLKEFCLTF